VLRRLLLATLVMALILAIHRSVVSAHRIRVHDVCGIPPWNYTPLHLTPVQVGLAGPPPIVVSLPAPTVPAIPVPALPAPANSVLPPPANVPPLVPIPTPSTPPATVACGPPTRVFQLQNDLTYEQCSIRHVVVTLQKTGSDARAVIGYLGIQNPAQADPKRAAIVATIKRNRFHVRALALSSATPQPAAAAGTSNIGAQVLFTLETEPQWFEQGETRYVQLTCCQVPGLKESFDLVDRIEIEFQYE
jgi:hypothetical protein